MINLKGLITKGEFYNPTCCQENEILTVNIGDINLHTELDKLFNLDAVEFFESYGRVKSPVMRLRYVILDEPPTENKSFDELSAEICVAMITGKHITGCYSEWTCGHGGFDYVHDEEGHSIFNELLRHKGKYVHLVM